MSRQDQAAKTPTPATSSRSSASALPARYTPRVAGYARGPFIEPAEVIPSEWRWRNARAYTIRDKDGVYWRCVRVFTDAGAVFAGYWAVELLGVQLPLPEWEE